MDSKGKVIRQFQSRHMALGVQRGDEFDVCTESMEWKNESSLVLYSDGLADAENALGEKFGDTGIVAILLASNSHQDLKDAVVKHLDGAAAIDDISLATIKLKK